MPVLATYSCQQDNSWMCEWVEDLHNWATKWSCHWVEKVIQNVCEFHIGKHSHPWLLPPQERRVGPAACLLRVTTGGQGFLLLLPEQSSDPLALPHGTRDSPAHLPPAGHSLQSSSLLPQPLLFTVYVKYLHCNNTIHFFNIIPPGFAFTSSWPHFRDHRPKARSWQEWAALAGTAAGLPVCPPCASPRKFSKRTRRVQAHNAPFWEEWS